MPKCWTLKEKIKECIWRRPHPSHFFIKYDKYGILPSRQHFLIVHLQWLGFFPTSRFAVYFIEERDLANNNYFDVNETRSSGLFLADVEQKPEESSCIELIKMLWKPVVSSYKDLKRCDTLKECCNMLYMVVSCILLVFMVPNFIIHILVLSQSLHICLSAFLNQNEMCSASWAECTISPW